MLMVSRGLRAVKGLQAFQAAHTARHIHIPVRPRPNASLTSRSAAQTARNLVGRFFTLLTTPGIGSEVAHGGARGLHAGRTIQQGLSLPARHALGRPLGAPHLPRAPKVPGHVAHVGLGTARNFTTARPIFQNMVDNVPVAGRAFWEADWDTKMRQEQAKMRLTKGAGKKAQKGSKSNAALQMRKENIPTVSRVSESEMSGQELDFERYFPTAALAPVTTYLSIPLAPTPTARHPLAAAPPTSDVPLLPLSVLGATHAMHDTHATRVSSLFSRLDAANVWARGASCTAHGDRTGLCTVLLVAFEGWDQSMVRDVIGEGGKGWCELYEVHNNPRSESPSDTSMSGLLSTFDSPAPTPFEHDFTDPAQSLVLPSTDLSATEYPFGFPRSPSSSVFSSTPVSAFSSPPSSPRLAPGHLGTGSDFDDAFFLSDRLSASDFELRMPEELVSEAEEEMSEWGSDVGSDHGDIGAAPSRGGSSMGFDSDLESRWSEVWHA